LEKCQKTAGGEGFFLTYTVGIFLKRRLLLYVFALW